MGDEKGFQLAGNAPEIYEKVLVPLWMARWADALLELAELKPGEVVLDVACGTGVSTRRTHQIVGNEGRVTGLDINAPMLAQARDLAAGLPIDWIESDVSETGFDSNAFDAVISLHGYHYFPDKPAALAEIKRVLKHDGRLAFSIWAGHSVYTSAICSAVSNHISPEIAAKQRSQRQTPSAEVLASQLTAAGYRNVQVHKQTLEIRQPATREFVPLHLGSMPIAAAFNALSDGQKERLICDVEEALREFEQGEELVYPDSVTVAMGHK